MEEPKVYCPVCKKLLGEIIKHHQVEHDMEWAGECDKVGEDDR